MHPYLRMLPLFVLLLALGCSLNQDLIGDPPARESPTPVVTGRSGDAWASPAFARSGALDAVLAHGQEQIQGQMVFGNAPCLLSGTVAGEGDGAQFAASVQVESVHLLEVDGIMHGDGYQRDGAYVVRSGACAGDAGTFTLNRPSSGDDENPPHAPRRR